MKAAEVGFRGAILGGGVETEFFFEYVDAVGACYAGEGVEEDFEVGVGGEKGFDKGEVEDVL